MKKHLAVLAILAAFMLLGCAAQKPEDPRVPPYDTNNPPTPSGNELPPPPPPLAEPENGSWVPPPPTGSPVARNCTTFCANLTGSNLSQCMLYCEANA